MKLTISKVRQSDFMQEHGILPMDIREIREKHLELEDWWKEGATIFWAQDAAERVAALIRPPTLEEIGATQHETDFGTVAIIPNCFPTTPQTDEQDQEGHAGIQEPVETPLPLPEVPDGEETCEDIELLGSVSAHAEVTEEETKAPVMVRILKRARNYRYVYASLNGERISVICPKKGRKNIVGKNVSVSCQVIDGAKQYTLIP